MPAWKNKTFATFLASFLGSLGLHRFYLYGFRDVWGWLHLVTVLSLPPALEPGAPPTRILLALPFVFSMLAGFLEALVIGLTPDDKWDARHNAGKAGHTRSRWPLALILVLTVAFGATAAIATIARAFDLLFTGGAYG
ncbi:MAG: NINE protein [Burkholderiaceae bacterium]